MSSGPTTCGGSNEGLAAFSELPIELAAAARGVDEGTTGGAFLANSVSDTVLN